ncbi:hypothetical protein TRFO_24937 [Tritrichomonas foetus]|uniref:BEACH domain-containing protein n=1 Tax=Tritrichomonas foetus TaxID=1144522 RepID=A0A1J4K624_9EUKA|nr:hypothetical protein TRFO_24937 [Tritrichomonas foetus]|eukprot:OHT06905.1 hypothetical protein TRFO_24937 [Tritrichomonas foetus]
MEKVIPIGSHEHFLNPVSELINVSYSIHKKYSTSQNSDIIQLLSLIPAIEPNKVDLFLSDIKSTTFKSTLQKFGYQTTFDLNQFGKLPIFEKCKDIETVLIFLHCTFWALNPIDQRDFAGVLALLEKTKNSKYQIIHNFCFELVLNRAITVASQKNEFQQFFPLFLNYIITLKNLPGTSFYLLMTLFNVVSECGTESHKALLKEAIEHIFTFDFDCLKNNDFSMLLDTIKVSINDFDRKSLLILGLVTNRGKASIHIMEIVHSLYKNFINLVKEIATDQTEIEKSSHTIHFDKPSRIPKHLYKIYENRKPFKPVHVDYGLLLNISEDKKILKDKIYAKVMNLADFLIHASNEVVFDFIAQFSVLLNQKDYFIEYCASFLDILIRVADSKTILTVIELLAQTFLFSPEYHVFDKLDWRINSLRNKVFDLISITDPAQILFLIRAAQRDPYLLNEHFMRILLHLEGFSPQIFSVEPFRTILIYSALELQKLTDENCYNLALLRSANFAFILAIMSRPDACDGLFSSPLFVNAFFSFIYESSLQEIIFYIFQKTLAIINSSKSKNYASYIVNFFQYMINSCLDELNDENYNLIIHRALNSLISGLEYNIPLAHNFVLLFDSFLNYMIRAPSLDLIFMSLKFFKILSNTEPYWQLSPRHFSILYASIQKVCGNVPNEKIITMLFCCIENASFLHSKDHILINFPSLLPLLFLIHAGSPTENVSLLTTFLHLCDFSKSNTAAFHDGEIDLLLIHYLCLEQDKGIVNFLDQRIEFNFNRDEAVPLILDLLSRIIHAKSNFSIAVNLLKLLTKTKDERIIRFIHDILLNGTSEFNRMTKIPLDTSEPFLQVNNFDWFSISNIFVLDFNLNMDEMISRRFRCCFTLFSITDGTNTFQIAIKNGIIHAFFKTPEKVSSGILFRNIFHAKWAHFSILVLRTKDKTKLFNFMNKERISDANIDLVVMNGPITMILGGSDFVSNNMKHPCFGQIYDFKFYPFRLSDEEIDILAEAPYSLNKNPLFSTNLIITEMKKIIPLENNVTLELLSTFHRKWHILDYFCEPSLFPSIITKVRNDVGLDIIFYMFSKHNDIQVYFMPYMDCLFNNILKDVEFSTYLSLFRIMNVLVDEKMKLEWFEKFIINIVLWSKSQDFIKIVKHWDLSLKQYKHYFESKNYFNDLLTQFMLKFGMENEAKNSDTMKTFCEYMVKVSNLNFDQNSFEILLSCIVICEDETNLWDLTKILYAVSNTEVALDSINIDKIQFLHKLLQYQNNSLTALAIFCIHNLSKKIEHYDLFAVCYTIIGYKDLDSLVDLLISQLPQFPRMISILTVLAIQTNKAEELTESIGKHLITENSGMFSIISIDFWYIWIILLMLNVSDSSCDVLCTFLSMCMSQINKQNGNTKCIDEIFTLMFRVSYLRYSYDMVLHVLHHLVSSFNLKDVKIPEYIAKYSFLFFFIHSPNHLHSPPLLELYHAYFPSENINNPSPNTSNDKLNATQNISSDETKKHNNILRKRPIINIFELESLIACDFFDFDIFCRVNIDTPNHLCENFYADLFLQLEPPNSPLFDKKLILFFYSPNKLDQQTQFTISHNLLNNLDNLTSEATKFIFRHLKDIQTGVIQLLENSRKRISLLLNDKTRHLTHVFLSNASSELQKNTPKDQKCADEINKKRRRSNKLCPNMHPFKYIAPSLRKITDNSYNKKPKTVNSYGTPVSKMTCLISRFESENNKKSTLYLYEDKFIFLYSNKRKVICFDKINYLLPRKVDSSCGYEIYTQSLKSILFFVSPKDFTALTANLKTYHFPKDEKVVFPGEFPDLSELTRDWQTHQISNFEYLMKLNIFSGRSFNQYRIYPVFPPVVSNFNEYNSNPDFEKLKPVTIISSPNDNYFNMNIKGNFTNHLNLPADYFFDFSGNIYQQNTDYISNDNKKQKTDTQIEESEFLPKWAKNRFEFIYKNRKKLETIDITPFIDRVFGVKKENNSFIQLFKHEHVKRFANSPVNLDLSEQKVFDMNQKIASILIFLKKNDTIVFWLILEDKKIYFADLTKGKLNIKSYSSIDCNDEPLFSNSFHHIFAYSRQKAILYYFYTIKRVQRIPIYTELPLFTMQCEDSILFCRDECSLCTMNIDGTNYKKFKFSDSKVTALYSSKQFNIAVYATIDGFIHVCDLETAIDINKYNIGYQTKQILVTSNLGFIVALSDDRITVFNVNGEFLSTYKFNFLIRKIFNFTLISGVDFISYETNENEVGYFEAFYPDQYRTLKKFNSMIQRISYDHFHKVFIAVETNGRIDLIPHIVQIS